MVVNLLIFHCGQFVDFSGGQFVGGQFVGGQFVGGQLSARRITEPRISTMPFGYYCAIIVLLCYGSTPVPWL